MFENVDGKSFVDVSEEMGKDFLRGGYQRGSAFGDFNNDGCIGHRGHVAEPEAAHSDQLGDNGNHWLMLSLTGHKSKRDAIGAKN